MKELMLLVALAVGVWTLSASSEPTSDSYRAGCRPAECAGW